MSGMAHPSTPQRLARPFVRFLVSLQTAALQTAGLKTAALKTAALKTAALKTAVILAGMAALLPAHAEPAGGDQRSAFDYADIFTLPFPRPEPDQLLSPEGERKADAIAWFIAGKMLEQQGELDSALETYRKSLDLDPANYPLAEKVAFEYVRRDAFAEALGLLKDCAVAAPQDARPRVTLAFLYSRYLEKVDLAEKYAAEALAIDPDDIAIYQRLYEIYQAQGEREAAEKVRAKALASKSKEAQYWLNLGVWLSEIEIPLHDSNPDPQAVSTLSKVFEKAVKLAPKDPVILTAAGDFYARIGDLTRSESQFTAAIEQDANLLPTREKLTQLYLRTDRPDDAIAQLEEIIRINPLAQGSYGLLGELYEEQGNPRRAAVAYEQSLLLNPGQEEAYDRLAEIYLGPSPENENKPLDAAKAIEILREGGNRFPNSIKMQVMLGISLLADQSYEEALAVFENADGLFEREPGVSQTPHFYFQYGIAAERSKDFDRASIMFEKAIEMDPSFHEALNYLGYMWIDRNERLDDAGEMIRRALSIEPDNAAYLDSLGWYHYRKAEFDQALEFLLKAHQIDGTNDPEICDHVGDAYNQLGEHGKAIEFWQKALANELAKDRVDVAEIEAKIEATKKTLTRLDDKKTPPSPVEQPSVNDQ